MRLGVRHSPLFLLLALSSCGRTTTITAREPVAIQVPGNTPVFAGLGPSQTEPEPSEPPIDTPPVDGPPVTTPAPKEIRVLIFPHLAKYSTPQGKERVLGSVHLVSEGECRSYELAGGRELAAFPAGEPFSFSVTEVKDPVRLSCQKPLKVLRESSLKSLSYAGTFEIHVTKPGVAPAHLKIINIIPLEEYLRGVVPSEMPGSWSVEALKVQAVAARTYAGYQIELAPAASKDPAYDLDDTVQYQAYQGLSAATENSDRAIRETEGQVIAHNEKLIMAFFSSDSGGYTEDAKNVFGRAADAYCKGKAEVYRPSLGPKGWTVDTSVPELQTQLVKARSLKTSEKLKALQVDEATRLPSGRATRIRLTLEDGTSKLITATSFASLLGLNSRMFTINANNQIAGRGFGHGVGMSQWGAKILADSLAWDYEKILGFYYTGVSLCPLGDGSRCAPVPQQP